MVAPVAPDTMSTGEVRAGAVFEMAVDAPDVVFETASIVSETPGSTIAPVALDTVSTEEVRAGAVSESGAVAPDVVSETASMVSETPGPRSLRSRSTPCRGTRHRV